MIIKLNQGDRIPFRVTAVVRDVPPSNPKYSPSHKFVGVTPTDPDAAVFMSPATAERQLGRIGLTLDTVVGQTIEFAKPGEYVDINRAPTNGTPAPTTAPTNGNAKQAVSLGGPIPGLDDEPAPDKLAAVTALYGRCLTVVLEKAVPKLNAADVGTTPEAVAAMTATIFIQACQRGALQ